MLGGHNNPPGNKYTPFRDNIIKVLHNAEYSDEELRAELSKLLDSKIDKYEVRRPTVVLKQVH